MSEAALAQKDRNVRRLGRYTGLLQNQASVSHRETLAISQPAKCAFDLLYPGQMRIRQVVLAPSGRRRLDS
jgi:hypothetical protein